MKISINGQRTHFDSVAATYRHIVERTWSLGIFTAKEPHVSYRTKSGASGELEPGDVIALSEDLEFTIAEHSRNG